MSGIERLDRPLWVGSVSSLMQKTAVRLLDAATVSDPPHCCRRTWAAPTSAMADKRQSTRASEWPLDFGNGRYFRGDPNDGNGSKHARRTLQLDALSVEAAGYQSANAEGFSPVRVLSPH